jgi:hypothetical protein
VSPPAPPHALPTHPARHARPRARLRIFLGSAAAVLAVGCLLGGFLTVLRIRQATPVSGGYTWHVIPSPNTPLAVNTLTSITVRTSTDAWAWGVANLAPSNGSGVISNPVSQPLVERWDGQHWRIIATPPTQQGGAIADIVALASDNAWAVGNQLAGGPENTNGASLIEHWDGHNWTFQPDQVFGGGLSGIAALSANDIWAVGDSGDPAGESGLIQHWDGHTWQAVAHPIPPEGVRFSGITALAPNDIWAVGSMLHPADSAAVFEHWDGSQWRMVPSPAIDPFNLGPLRSHSQFFAISAVSATDIWAAGVTHPAIFIPNSSVPFFEHWDGHT